MPPKRPPGAADTNVHVPVKIKVRGAVDTDRLTELVADRVGNQVGRALDATEGRGAPNLATFDIRITGATSQVSAEDQRAISAATSAGVIRGVRRAHDLRARQGAPAGARSAPGKPGAATKPARSVPPVQLWTVFDAVGSTAFDDALVGALYVRFDTAIPDTYGVMFRLAGVPETQLWIVTGGRYAVRIHLTDPNYIKPGADTAASVDPGTGEYTLELVPDGLALYRELALKRARTQLGTGKGSAPSQVGKVTATADPTAPQAALDDQAQALVDRYTAGWEQRIGAFYRLGAAGTRSRLLPLLQGQAAALGNQPRIDVVCLIHAVSPADADAIEAEAAEGGDSLRARLPTGEGAGGKEGQGGEDEGPGGRGVVIAPQYKEGASIFPGGPPDPNARVVRITCEPYDGEPSIDTLGAPGQQMRALIAEIAARLDFPTCQYAAHFCITAGTMLAVRASQVEARFQTGEQGFYEELVVGALDDNGAFEFRPLPSVAIQYLQHIAGTVPVLRRLIELVFEHVARPMSYAAWGAHWFEHVIDEAGPACARIYLYACQIVMQQLLNTSLDAVHKRLGRLDDYTRVFAVLVRTQLADQVETIMLRDALARFRSIAGERHGRAAYEWIQQHQLVTYALRDDLASDEAQLVIEHGSDPDLMLRLADRTNYVFGRAAAAPAPVTGAGQIVETDTGEWAIRGSDGQLYTSGDLDRMMTVRQQLVASIDPLISQLTHNFVSEVRPLVEDPRRIPGFVSGLLQSMESKNLEVAGKNRGDPKYAFEHGQIHKTSYDEDAQPALRIPTVPGGRFVLSGIHAMAHEQVGRWFAGDPFYRSTLDTLLSSELGWRELKSDLVVFGSIVLSVICPPVGAAFGLIAGIAVGISEYRHAKEQETIYGALINPEDVLSYAEIQVELFVAKLGLALSFLAVLPEIGAALKGVGAASKRLVEKGVEATARRVAMNIIEQQLEHIAELCADKFVVALASELVIQSVQNKVFEVLVTPLIEAQIEDLKAELRAEGVL